MCWPRPCVCLSGSRARWIFVSSPMVGPRRRRDPWSRERGDSQAAGVRAPHSRTPLDLRLGNLAPPSRPPPKKKNCGAGLGGFCWWPFKSGSLPPWAPAAARKFPNSINLSPLRGKMRVARGRPASRRLLSTVGRLAPRFSAVGGGGGDPCPTEWLAGHRAHKSQLLMSIGHRAIYSPIATLRVFRFPTLLQRCRRAVLIRSPRSSNVMCA